MLVDLLLSSEVLRHTSKSSISVNSSKIAILFRDNGSVLHWNGAWSIFREKKRGGRCGRGRGRAQAVWLYKEEFESIVRSSWLSSLETYLGSIVE
jgi:hypothetical protein